MKQTILHIISRFKYIIAFGIFVVFVGFVGDHCVINRIRQKSEISNLKNKIASERDRFISDSLAYLSLQKDPDAVRKIAREHYYMKNSGEDVFMISDAPEDED